MTDLFYQLPIELFMVVLKDYGQKLAYRVCKSWSQNFNTIFSNISLFKTYCEQYNIVDFCNKTNIKAIHNFECINIFGYKIIDEDNYEKITLYDSDLKIWHETYFLKYYYLVFKHFFLNKNNKEYLNKIINGNHKNHLLGLSLDDEFYDGVNYLIAKGSYAHAYLYEKINSTEIEIEITPQLNYLLKHKSLNLGWLYYHLFKERKNRGLSRIVLGKYLVSFMLIIRNNMTEITGNSILKNDIPLGLIGKSLYYELDETSGPIIGILTRSYIPMNAFNTIVINYIRNSEKSVEDIFHDFRYFIDNHMIDLPWFYITFKKHVDNISKVNPNENLYEFIGLVGSLISEDILVYL